MNLTLLALALDGVFSQSWFILLMLLVIFGVIVLGVILIKRYSKLFHNDEKPKSDKEIAEEEVNRLLVDVEDDSAREEMEEAAREIEKKSKEKDLAPTPEEAAEEEVSRVTEEVLDPEAQKAMEEWAKSHPEEEKEAEEAEKK